MIIKLPLSNGSFNGDPRQTMTLIEPDKFLASYVWLTGDPTLIMLFVDPSAAATGKAAKTKKKTSERT